MTACEFKTTTGVTYVCVVRNILREIRSVVGRDGNEDLVQFNFTNAATYLYKNNDLRRLMGEREADRLFESIIVTQKRWYVMCYNEKVASISAIIADVRKYMPSPNAIAPIEVKEEVKQVRRNEQDCARFEEFLAAKETFSMLADFAKEDVPKKDTSSSAKGPVLESKSENKSADYSAHDALALGRTFYHEACDQAFSANRAFSSRAPTRYIKPSLRIIPEVPMIK